MTTIITALEAAAILSISTTSATTAFSRVMKRAAALGLAGDCRRCKGTGTYGMMNGRGENYCYGCAGCGKSAPITAELVATIKARTEAGELAGYFAAESESRMRKVLAGRGVNADVLAAGLVEVFAAIAAFVAARPAMPVRTTVNQWPNANGVEIEICRNGVAIASTVCPDGDSFVIAAARKALLDAMAA